MAAADVNRVFRSGEWLCFQSRRFSGFDHAIHSLPRLSPGEAERILCDLGDYLAEHWPEVQVLC